MTLYNAQLITNFIAQAQTSARRHERRAPAAARLPPTPRRPPLARPRRRASKKSEGGFAFIDAILPDAIGTTALLFAFTAIFGIALGYTNRVGTVWVNTLMLQRLQLRLHDKLIALGPKYHGQHDVGENQAVIMNYSQQAQGALRDVLSSPIVRSVSLSPRSACSSTISRSCKDRTASSMSSSRRC